MLDSVIMTMIEGVRHPHTSLWCSWRCRCESDPSAVFLQGEESLLSLGQSFHALGAATELSLHGLQSQIDGIRKQHRAAEAEASATQQDGADGAAQFVQRVSDFSTLATTRITEMERALSGLQVGWAAVLVVVRRHTSSLAHFFVVFARDASQTPSSKVCTLIGEADITPERALERIHSFVSAWGRRIPVCKRKVRSAQSLAARAAARKSEAGARTAVAPSSRPSSASSRATSLVDMLARRRAAMPRRDSEDSDA